MAKVNSSRTYTRGKIVNFEEDRVHEFKGHRTISVENRKVDTKTGELFRTRQQWSKYLCGMLNSGSGGVLYGGILDNGEVNGFMMSPYQMDHVVIQLDDLFERFSPPVPKSLYKVEFIPQLEPFDEEYVPDPFVKDPRLAMFEHKLRTDKRCWCDNEAAASHSFGIVLPWYIIEVTLEKQSHTEFRAEDGIVYERMHGTTVQRPDQAGLARTRCDRCGELGHMARACPRPPTCFRCGETGHQAFRCPRGAGHKDSLRNKRNVTKTDNCQQFCHLCESYGHGVRECPEMMG